LQKDINEFVRGDFSRGKTLSTKRTNGEIAALRTNFSIMEEHIAKQMLSLKKNNRDLETLFYVASHDLRPPLRKVKELTAETIKSNVEPAELEKLKQIDLACEQAISIVDELDLITNLKHSDIVVEELNLKELIRSVYSEFKSTEGVDNVIFSLEINTKREMVSSKGLIKSIFRSLIDNGIKYATRRNIHSFLKIQVFDQNDDMLRIEVTDNGIGIEKDIQEKIFTMFFRGTTLAKGAGMGLYVAQCAIEKLDGAIGVESDGQSGSSFTLLLPRHYKIKNTRLAQSTVEPAFRLN
jgi:signal transduction histidine kinase